MSSLRTIQGCPVFSDIAPYIAILVNDEHATVNSIYRGQDAAWILHKHGKHSQAELYWLSIHGTPSQRAAAGLPPGGGGVNPPTEGTHLLRGDGVAYGAPIGTHLQWWQQGFDVNDSDVQRIINAGKKYGWELYRPYSSSSEFHHLNFRVQPARPRPGTRLWARLWRLRFSLPRS